MPKNQIPPLDGVPDQDHPSGPTRTEAVGVAAAFVAFVNSAVALLVALGVLDLSGEQLAVVNLTVTNFTVLVGAFFARRNVWSARTVHKIDSAALVTD